MPLFLFKHMGIKISLIKQKDYDKILELINFYATKGFMLPKSKRELMQLRHYFIAKEEKRIIGGVGIKEWSENLVEIVSLAVSLSNEGKGIGTSLIKKAVKKAGSDRYKRIFTLTLRPNLFKRLGFKEKSITAFPEKIWGDCKNCPKNASGPNDPKCNEKVLEKIL